MALWCQLCVRDMALKPFVFHLHRYRRNVLLLALASALLCLCGCVRTVAQSVHTLLEVFPVFEAHPQAAYTITARFFPPLELGSAQMHTQKKEDRHQKRKWGGGKKKI